MMTTNMLAFTLLLLQIAPGWDPKAAADVVLRRLIPVTAPQVKGAHDADLAIVDGRAYIVAMVNDIRPGETAEWPFIYDTLSVVNLKTNKVEKIVTFAKGGETYAGGKLAEGACFVPRILAKDKRTLRCYFASEAPKARQAQTWYRDYDIRRGEFEPALHKVKLATAAGVFDMQPKVFYDDAVKLGFAAEERDFGLYFIDSFKRFDSKTTYAVVNNYPIGQNALATLNPALDTFTILGHFNPPAGTKLTEAAVNRLPDGSWLAVCRQEGKDRNYKFFTSKDGKTWSGPEERPWFTPGNNSKPTFDRFKDVYYLGWQDVAKVSGVNRSVFNIDVSKDGVHWQRKYRFETAETFQYPTFREYRGKIYLTVTQGQKERIMFGLLE